MKDYEDGDACQRWRSLTGGDTTVTAFRRQSFFRCVDDLALLGLTGE